MHEKLRPTKSRLLTNSVQFVITKTGNEHQRLKKHQQTTTNHQQMTTNHQQTTTNHQQMTTNYQQTTTIFQQTITNAYFCTTNQQNAVISYLLPAPGNYKDHLDFERHRQLVRGNCLLLSYYVCGTSKIESICFGRLSSYYSSNYCSNATERENQLTLKSTKGLSIWELFIHGVKLIGHCMSRWNKITGLCYE